MTNQFNGLIANAIRMAKINSIGTVKDLEKDAKIVRNILSQIQQKYPEASDEEIQSGMQQILVDLLDEETKLKEFRNNLFRRNAIKYLLSSPNIIEEIYKRIIAEESRNGKKNKVERIVRYSPNPKHAAKQIMEIGISTIRDAVSKVPLEDLKMMQYEAKRGKGKQHIKRVLNLENKSKSARDETNMVVEILTGTEKEALKYYLQNVINLEKTEKELKKDYIYAIRYILNSLNKFGVLDNYVTRQNEMNARLGLRDMPEIPKNLLENTLSEENLEKMSVSRLATLFTFWDNRLVKEIVRIYRTNYIMHELELDTREAINSGTTIEQSVTSEELESLNIKINLMAIKFAEYYKKYKELSKGRTSTYDLTEDINEGERQIGESYKKYFSTIGGLSRFENNFSEDFGMYYELENTKINLYTRKDNGIIGLLALLNNEKVSENWGIIEENKSDKILMAVDIEGLNMPLRLHINRDLIKQYMIKNQGNSLVPIYEGARDFWDAGRYIPTQALVPLTSEQIKAIKQLNANTKITDHRSEFIRHLNYLADSTEYPEHLYEKRTVIKRGKQKIKKSIRKEYIDLDTGKKFRLGTNGMIEQNNDGRDD